jgi:hypothetical protein
MFWVTVVKKGVERLTPAIERMNDRKMKDPMIA